MNAELRRFGNDFEEFRLDVPELALQRFWLRLGRARSLGEAWDASAVFAAPPREVDRLLEYWLDGFDFRRAEARLNALPLWRWRSGRSTRVVCELRSSEAFAVPLLLLGDVMPPPELLQALSEPSRTAAGQPGLAFHVVCPVEQGDSELDDPAHHSSLMAALGYSRYVVHGSGRSARVAQAVAEHDSEHVAALHVTSLLAFPNEDVFELAGLSSEEKSQLALLRELQALASTKAPGSPLERLACAVAELSDSLTSSVEWRDWLLADLTIAGVAPAASAARALPPLPPLAAKSMIPTSLSCFPLGEPTLRRFAERRHRIVSFRNHERGGGLLALEQPLLLVRELRELGNQLG